MEVRGRSRAESLGPYSRIVYAAALAGAVAVSAVLPPSAHAQQPEYEWGRTLVGWLVEGNSASLESVLSQDLKGILAAQGGLAAFVQRVISAGPERALEGEHVYSVGGTTTYYRLSRFAGFPSGRIMTVFAWDRNGTVVQMLVAPEPSPAPSQYLDYQTRTVLRLPFDGEWTVFWGGRTFAENAHVVAPDQRFAYDFLVVREGSTHRGNGKSKEDYYCWGVPVLAPAAGTVTASVDSLPDNEPGMADRRNPAGNHVVIDHGNGEFSLLAHLRWGSVRVTAGTRVEAGQPIGACGNSGNSSEPHVHYHLQTAGRFGEGVGLPAQFSNYVSAGRVVTRGEPTRGQTVRHRGN